MKDATNPEAAIYETDPHEVQAVARYHSHATNGLEKKENLSFEASSVRSEIIMYGAHGSREDRLRRVAHRQDEDGQRAK